MQITSGSFVVINLHKSPVFFWAGLQIDVLRFSVSKRGTFIRVKKNSIPKEILQKMSEEGLKVKEVK